MTNLNSGCSIASSCSIAEKTRTISVMITGHRKVMCTALILATINLVMVYVGRQGQKGTRGQDNNKYYDQPQESDVSGTNSGIKNLVM